MKAKKENKKLQWVIFTILMAIAIWLIGPHTPLQAHDSIQSQLQNSGIDYMFMGNFSDGRPDTITIFSEDGLATVCSINGVSIVWVNNVKHACEPV